MASCDIIYYCNQLLITVSELFKNYGNCTVKFSFKQSIQYYLFILYVPGNLNYIL